MITNCTFRVQSLAATGLLIGALALPYSLSATEPSTDSHGGQAKAASSVVIPPSIHHEHEQLHAKLAKLTQMDGELGNAARNVAEKLHPHFVKEEEYAMPPLGALRLLAAGEDVPTSESVIQKSRELKTRLPEMLQEHKSIVTALDRLRAAGQAAGKPEAGQFADQLTQHAKQEEEILYPASILVGDYLGAKAKR